MTTVSASVSILVDGQGMVVYLSRPEATVKPTGGVVRTEAFGVKKPIQEVTDKLSREGEVAVAAVLYHRSGSHLLFSYRGEADEARIKAIDSLKNTERAKGLNATRPTARALLTSGAAASRS
jgi:dienelactone hydrolase